MLAFAVCVGLLSYRCCAQTDSDLLERRNAMTFNTDSVGPVRFVAAHGRRALIGGYASSGLEIWAYPFQVLSDYRVSFRVAGTTTPVGGQTILRRVTYNTNSITRIYLGVGFSVRETLFVPLNEPGAIVSYSVQSARPVSINIHAMPILNLMWPASVGGQSTAWSSSLSAFILSEASDGYSAVVGSPDIVAHDESGNRTTQGGNGVALGFTLRAASSGNLSVYIALNTPGTLNQGTLFQRLIADRQAFRDEYDQHVSELEKTMIGVTTPDDGVNRAIAWSELALDQAWVCNNDLGCGYVAGYGPSRGARRPQYDWFFAGDGLIAADAAATAGNISQARDELEFILRYQDKKTGMIWHEMSQSAGLIDWLGKYPYMYVHVDITFQFLNTLDRYVTTSGDRGFVRGHWTAIAAAYHYCESLIDAGTGLPRIPSDKEGGDEQDRMSDDLGLSVSWVEASSAFQRLARLSGHETEAAEAQEANQRARASIPSHYWDAHNGFWINGHSESGAAVQERRSSPSEAILLGLFTTEQNEHLLDELSSASFQTDWGSRGVGADSKGFDPTSYAKGSVSALGTAELAKTFWYAHRSTQAFALWNSLLPWFSLDSMEHMHEVLAGNIYQPQEESVPEQTWSSAGFISASVHGLLGLQVDALDRKISFAPSIPSTWHDLTVARVPFLDAKLLFTLHQSDREIDLRIDNPGSSFSLRFEPTLPLGAIVDRVEVNEQRTRGLTSPGETQTSVDVEVEHGANEVRMALHGGVSILATNSTPLLGEASHDIHIIDAHLVGDTLKITADVPAERGASMEIATDWRVVNASNANVDRIAPGLDRITFVAPRGGIVINHYQQIEATLQFERHPGGRLIQGDRPLHGK